MGIQKKTCSVRLDLDLIDKLKTYAKRDNRNFTNLIETILINYVDERQLTDPIPPTIIGEAKEIE